MNILLVRPPYKRLMGIRQSPYFSLSIGYVGAYLDRHGFRARLYNGENEDLPRLETLPGERDIFETRAEGMALYASALDRDGHPAWEEFRRILYQVKPDAVGISVLSNEVGAALKLSRLVKAWRKDCPSEPAGQGMAEGRLRRVGGRSSYLSPGRVTPLRVRRLCSARRGRGDHAGALPFFQDRPP